MLARLAVIKSLSEKFRQGQFGPSEKPVLSVTEELRAKGFYPFVVSAAGGSNRNGGFSGRL